MTRVSVEVEDHVARVTLTRGDKMNALDDAMVDGIIAAGQQVRESDARAVVLAGEGNAFCAGLDLESFAKMGGMDAEAWLMERTHEDANRMQELAMVWRRVPVPVVAAVQGVAFGGGLQLALGADIRIAHPEARFSLMEMKWGLVPDLGGMALLPQLVRSDVLRWLTYTAEAVGAEQALAWGLVTSLAEDPQAEALELARRIAGQSPSAIRAAKRLIEVAESAPRAEVLLAESRESAGLIGKADQMEVISARMQGRAPKFS